MSPTGHPRAAPLGAARPERGQELELTIDSLAYGGEGVARLGEGGYVVFVAGAVPGDRVRAVVYKRKRNYAHARTLEVLDASPERIPPLADHPGVAWQVLPYERQLQIKQAQAQDALRRIGGFAGFEVEQIVPALEEWRYRNKLEYSFGQDLHSGELVCGFHAPAGWNMVLPIEDCLLASREGNLARRVAMRWCREQGLRAWSRGGEEGGGLGDAPRGGGRTPVRRSRGPSISPADGASTPPAGGPSELVPGTGANGAGSHRAAAAAEREERTGPGPDGRALLRNLVVREGRRTGRLQVRIVTTDGELDAPSFAAALAAELGEQRLSGVLWTRSRQLAETTAGGETELVWGEAELPERLGELELRISPEAFFQTNTEMAEVLYGIAAEYAALEGWERVYDLYCGIGTIALALAPRAGEVWGIELVEQAVADAIAAARRNEISNTHFFAGDTRLALPELLARAGRPDVLVVDPPRAGLSQKVVRRIIECTPRRIVYISCNPTTLAPNAAQLVEAGWELRRVRPVDMFPQTHHVECVALLERQGTGAAADLPARADASPEAEAGAGSETDGG
jgi:tRNA/tmRNA/rRNA uracil-C5-methylase (TrmA/RlmC/RlmD family)